MDEGGKSTRKREEKYSEMTLGKKTKNTLPYTEPRDKVMSNIKVVTFK